MIYIGAIKIIFGFYCDPSDEFYTLLKVYITNFLSLLEILKSYS